MASLINEKDQESFAKILGWVKTLDSIIFKKARAIQSAQLDGWALVLEEVRKVIPQGQIKLEKNRVFHYNEEVRKSYGDWKEKPALLAVIIHRHVNEIVANTLGLIESRGLAGMNREEFMDMFADPYVKNLAGVDTATLPYDYGMVLFAQACHETGNFKSTSFKSGCNMFGMKQSQKRKRIWSGKVGAYAGYNDYRDSLADRMNWDQYNSIQFIDVEQYMTAVMGKNKNGLRYAEDPDYIKKWVTWIKTVYKNASMAEPYIRNWTKGSSNASGDDRSTGTGPGLSTNTEENKTNESTLFDFKKSGTLFAVGGLCLAVYLIFK